MAFLVSFSLSGIAVAASLIRSTSCNKMFTTVRGKGESLAFAFRQGAEMGLAERPARPPLHRGTKRLFRRDAESPSRTGINTRDARATWNTDFQVCTHINFRPWGCLRALRRAARAPLRRWFGKNLRSIGRRP